MQREEREIPVGGCHLCAPHWGPGPQSRHAPQTGNRTGNPLIHSPTLNPLSHTSQGRTYNISRKYLYVVSKYFFPSGKYAFLPRSGRSWVQGFLKGG